MDWQALRTFLCVASEGSISAGAAAAGVSQPTASRHVSQLEEQVGEPLLIRHSRGVGLTPMGELVWRASQEVESAMARMERQLAGAREAPRGVVRVAASEVIGTQVIAPEVAAFRARWPELELVLVLGNTSADLTHGEAMIAVRLYEPREPELVIKRIGELSTGFFASRSYLERRGEPQDVADLLAGHDLIGFDPGGPMARAFSSQDARFKDATYSVRTDALSAQLSAALHGAGVILLQRALAHRHVELVQILEDSPLPALPVWIAKHEDMRHGEPVRVVHEWLEGVLRHYIQGQ